MPPSPTLFWEVSTQTLPDAFERYLIGMSDLCEVSEVSDQDRANFFNVTSTTLTSSGAIGWSRSVRQTLTRDARVLRRSDIDGLSLMINRTVMKGDCDGRSFHAMPGAVQLRDMERVAVGQLESVDMIVMLAPRNLLPPALLTPDMHGLILPPEQPGSRLIEAHLRGLIDVAADLPEDDMDSAIQALLLLIARITGIDAPLGGPELAAMQATVRRAAIDYIEQRMLAMELAIDVDAVAGAAGVSRATLYRAFDSKGGVNRYVQDRRLHHARLALRRRPTLKATITDIAHDFGFSSLTHFSRLFQARYGYRPSEVEPARAPQDMSASAGPIRHDLLGQWLIDLKA